MNNESNVQTKIIKELEKDGWYVIKLIKTNKNGIPDLIAIKKNECKLIEIKTLKGKLSEIQKYRIKELTDLGIDASVIYG